jgi:hypothetical protein
MPTYKRKPEEIEAAQWNKAGDAPGVVENGKGDVSFEFKERLDANKQPHKNCIHCERPSSEHGYIQKTMRGGLVVCPGDWITKGSGGVKLYKDKDFKEKYEAV